jgi:(p)ppGpp synthase/HD superfamily hydrolase
MDDPGDAAMPVLLTSAYRDALEYAIQLHAGQTRKGTEIPYISHVLAVSATVLEFGGTEEEAIAALLHDAVEDAGGQTTRKQIAERFGEPIAQIVDGCSDDSPELGQKKKPWRIRKNTHIAHLKKASPSVLLVTAADKLHNARALATDFRYLGDALWDRFTASRDDILWYYGAIVDALDALDAGDARLHKRQPDGTGTITDLDRLIDELEVAVEDLIVDVGLMTMEAAFEDTLQDDALDFFGPVDMHDQLGRVRSGDQPPTP